MYPVEKAIEDWQSFFEPTLDQVLEKISSSHQHLENLLS
jgi:hypothetical protein